MSRRLTRLPAFDEASSYATLSSLIADGVQSLLRQRANQTSPDHRLSSVASESIRSTDHVAGECPLALCPGKRPKKSSHIAYSIATSRAPSLTASSSTGIGSSQFSRGSMLPYTFGRSPGPFALPKQLGQPRDVDGDPPRLVRRGPPTPARLRQLGPPMFDYPRNACPGRVAHASP